MSIKGTSYKRKENWGVCNLEKNGKELLKL
jgi:hypothetical protein